MIQKIQNNEYLKRFDNMTIAQKDEYMKRVGEWLESRSPLLAARAGDEGSRFQNAIQCSAAWSDVECRAWEEGARLLTALAQEADTWLPDMLYTKTAKRCISRMIYILEDTRGNGSVSGAGDGGVRRTGEANRAVGHGTRKADSTTAKAAPGVNPGAGAVPVRPKHIDQYIHLLPKSTQERAATVKGLLRDLDTAREKTRLLTDDPQADGNMLAQWARTVTRLDEKVKAIYRELDAEWAKLVKEGRVVVDDLGNAHAVAQESGAEGDGGADSHEDAGNTDAQRKAALLRKFLIDRRNAKTDVQREKWIAKYKEMVALGGQVTDKVRQTAEYYGINLEEL